MRSLLGSVAPFAFAFSRLSTVGQCDGARHGLDPAAIRGRRSGAQPAGLRAVFVDSGGARLAGLGHPAFLAGFCLAAIYACLIELYRDGRSRWLLLWRLTSQSWC